MASIAFAENSDFGDLKNVEAVDAEDLSKPEKVESRSDLFEKNKKAIEEKIKELRRINGEPQKIEDPSPPPVDDNSVSTLSEIIERQKETPSGEKIDQAIRRQTAPSAVTVRKDIFIPPIAYEVKYDLALFKYSVYNPRREHFLKYVKSLHLPKAVLQTKYNHPKDYKDVLLNALAYDYAYHDPQTAERYYRVLVDSGKNISFGDRILRYADFLLRTGRGPEILDYIPNSSVCVMKNVFFNKCMYYYGLGVMFKTGKVENNGLKRCGLKKAKEILKNYRRSKL